MKKIKLGGLIGACFAAAMVTGAPAGAQQSKPNIVVIMGDDIGMWNIGAYHRAAKGPSN